MEQNILTAGPGKDTKGLILELELYKTRRNSAGKKWREGHSGRTYNRSSHTENAGPAREKNFCGGGKAGKECFLKTNIK